MGSPSLESPPIMNPSYRQTFSRHKVLFSLPVVITTVLAIWFVAGTPKQYKAGATLFVDNKSGPSSPGRTEPAGDLAGGRAQQLLTELLATKQFQGEVGRRGPLDEYLAKHPSEGWGAHRPPEEAARERLGRGPEREGARRQARLDESPGGQVLGIEFHGPTPEVAVGTLKAMITAFNQQRRELDVSRQQGAWYGFSNRSMQPKARIARLNAQIASGSHSTRRDPGPRPGLRTAQSQLRSRNPQLQPGRTGLDAAKVKGRYYR